MTYVATTPPSPSPKGSGYHRCLTPPAMMRGTAQNVRRRERPLESPGGLNPGGGVGQGSIGMALHCRRRGDPPPPDQSDHRELGINQENLVGPFFVHTLLGPRPPPPFSLLIRPGEGGQVFTPSDCIPGGDWTIGGQGRGGLVPLLGLQGYGGVAR